jgi:hypothetical protein
MQSDDTTLVEPLEHQLLRASFLPSAGGDALLRASLDAPVVSQRVIALRGLLRRNLMTTELWRRVLDDPDVAFTGEVVQQIAHPPHAQTENDK